MWRWGLFVVSVCLFLLRIYLVKGWFIVTYGLGIFLLNNLIGFLSPQVKNSLRVKFSIMWSVLSSSFVALITPRLCSCVCVGSHRHRCSGSAESRRIVDAGALRPVQMLEGTEQRSDNVNERGERKYKREYEEGVTTCTFTSPVSPLGRIVSPISPHGNRRRN